MEKYFCNYNQSLALKELGFDEPCFAGYRDSEWIGTDGPNSRYFHAQLFSNHQFDNDQKEYCSAPLKSQVFEWFRKNHLLGHEINCPFASYSGKNAEIRNEGRYELYITDEEQLSLPEDIFYSTDYFEAESKAIDKFIEIVKNK